ncbi:hypothetical protein ACLOJK_016638 [Asimina triloba]
MPVNPFLESRYETKRGVVDRFLHAQRGLVNFAAFGMLNSMGSLPQREGSISPITSKPSRFSNSMATTDDQHFLLMFIMGTYFGPDLEEENPKKSSLQRIAEGLPPYSSDQLSGSHMKRMEVEQIYYYVLREADQSVIVKPPSLHKFLQGSLFPPTCNLTDGDHQFLDLFPPHLHQQKRIKNRHRIIENIVFINDPEISYLKPKDLERFKRLAKIENLSLDRDAAKLHDGIGVAGYVDDPLVKEANGKLPLRRSSRKPRKKRHPSDYLDLDVDQPLAALFDFRHRSRPHCSIPLTSAPCHSLTSFPSKKRVGSVDKVGSAMLFFPSHPTTDEWNNIVKASKAGIALTGSIADKPAGPTIGLVDIGVCEDAYLFRMSLPGVRKDERDFSCEVESDGRVLIKGVTTTGEKLVFRHSQVFEMQTQNHCPPGRFSVSFQLPGPVEPQEFTGNFGSDGILEGVEKWHPLVTGLKKLLIFAMSQEVLSAQIQNLNTGNPVYRWWCRLHEKVAAGGN